MFCGTCRVCQRGLTLIEVLVTLLILSVGMLGVAALQLTSMRGTQDAYFQTQAVALARQIVGAMRANPDGVAGGRYSTQFTAQSNRGACRHTNMSRYDLCLWKAALAGRLPAGRGAIDTTGAGLAVICIRWSIPQARTPTRRAHSPCGPVPAAFEQYVLRAVIH